MGAEQQEAFEKIKKYLSSPPVLKAPKRGIPFRLYLAAEDKIIGAVLTQETEGKEYVITYVGQRLIDAEAMIRARLRCPNICPIFHSAR